MTLSELKKEYSNWRSVLRDLADAKEKEVALYRRLVSELGLSEYGTPRKKVTDTLLLMIAEKVVGE